MSEQLHHPIPPDGDVGRDGTFGACEEGTGCTRGGEGVDGDLGRVEEDGGLEGRSPESVPGAARDEEEARGAGGAVLLPRAEAGEEGLAEGAVRVPEEEDGRARELGAEADLFGLKGFQLQVGDGVARGGGAGAQKHAADGVAPGGKRQRDRPVGIYEDGRGGAGVAVALGDGAVVARFFYDLEGVFAARDEVGLEFPAGGTVGARKY